MFCVKCLSSDCPPYPPDPDTRDPEEDEFDPSEEE